MENIAEINLKTIRKNALSIKNAIPKEVFFYAVVKANAYGHGAEQISNAIYDIADGFCVAILEEGISLRVSGIDKEILVLTPIFLEDIERGIRYDLTFTVDDISLLKKINSVAKKLGKTAKIQIKIDTGMHRFGIEKGETKTYIDLIKKLKSVTLTGIYSHFYNAKSDKDRQKQIKIFKSCVLLFKENFPLIKAHISASGGALKGDFFDAVRIGIALYGYYPFKINSPIFNITPALKVITKVIKNRKINKNDNLLYGNFKLKSQKIISLIRFGYADGLSRKARLNPLNSRCMDVSAIKKVNKNRKFYILNKNADQIAKKYGTISYEILTSVTKRAKMTYIR